MRKPRRRIMVADCETDPFKRMRVPEPFLWGFYDGSAYHQFTDTDAAMLWLMEQDCVCYAHNGGKFDWHFILPWLGEYDDVMLINGRLAKFQLGLAECRDSYNLLPVPLAAYKKDEIDYSIFEADRRKLPKNWEAITRYLKSDCVYLWELITQFVERYGLQMTQAGASMRQWKAISKANSGPDVPRTDEQFYETFAPFYYGGRVECFRSGVIDTAFGVYDINSAYPRAMLEKHPYSDNYAIDAGFAKGADFYRVRCVSRGAFPFRGEGGAGGANFGLTFPADSVEREYTITKWELSAALDTGTITNVEYLESITFVGHVDFADYVNHFYEARKACKAAGDEAGSLFAKLFMNSLYGKFAANPKHYKDFMIVPMSVICALDGDADGWRFSGELGPWGLAEKDLEPHRRRYYNVATGASITGYVRAMLWRAIHASKGMLYCDTDCIVAEAPGASVVLGDEIGQWKHEGDFDRAGIGGKKLYIFRGVPDAKGKRKYKIASKGVRLSPAQLWKVAAGGSVTYIPEVPTFSAKSAPRFNKRRVVNTARG